VVIRLLQANCRRSPDCTTTLLTKATGKAEVVLIQEFWADKRNPHGIWKTTQDANFHFIFDRGGADKRKPPRALTAVAKGVTFEALITERDLVAVWVGEPADRFLIINVYNPNPDKEKQGPLRSGRAIRLVQQHRHWVIAGDFNAHHPSWSGKERTDNSGDTLGILSLGVLKIEPGTPTRRPDSDRQEPSTLDLVIAAPELAERVTEAVIADDEMTTGSDHETLAWEVYVAEGPPPTEDIRWKTRQPKDDNELERWRKVWSASLLEGNPLAANPLPIETICEKFSKFLMEILGTKRICQRTKRWWSPEVNEAHAAMGKARADLRNRRISPQHFKVIQKNWFRTVRKAKRISWTTFLQEGKEEDIWRAISGKLAPMPMNALRTPEGQTVTSPTEKAKLLAATSFPEDENQSLIPPIPPDPSPLSLWHSEDISRFLGSRNQRSAPGPDGLTYREVRLWFLIDPQGLTDLINRMVMEGLPKSMKIAKVVYIHTPGKTDWEATKSYRAISLLSTLSKMAEKAVADYLSLIGEERGWWHKGQCGSRTGRSTIDALAYLRGEVNKNRRRGRHTACDGAYGYGPCRQESRISTR
jgi:hypothetical protein